MAKSPRAPVDDLDKINSQFASEMQADAGKGVLAIAEDRRSYFFLANYKNKPRWSDESAVSTLVNKLRDEEHEAQRQDADYDVLYGPDFVLVPNPAALGRVRVLLAEIALRAPPPPRAEESEAIQAAQHGKPEQLANLVARGRCTAPAALRLAAEFVRGVRDPRTGKLKRKPGRPKMSNAERRKHNPIHEVSEEFEIIRAMLLAMYPEQRGLPIHDLAERIARKRIVEERRITAGAHRSETRASLTNYKARARRYGHKLR